MAKPQETTAKKSQVADAILKQLKDPFKPELVKFRPGGGKSLAYIDARDVMKRLDDVMGPENWQDEYIDIEGGKICKLWLRIDGEWLYKSNGANDTKVEAVKGGISNALKRAAVNWGVGRYLYYMPAHLNSSNIDEWPAIFKPGAPEDWEDVAELQAEFESGMDVEEVAGQAVATTLEIQAAKTVEELDKLVKTLEPETQRILADVIHNKTDELNANS